MDGTKWFPLILQETNGSTSSFVLFAAALGPPFHDATEALECLACWACGCWGLLVREPQFDPGSMGVSWKDHLQGRKRGPPAIVSFGAWMGLVQCCCVKWKDLRFGPRSEERNSAICFGRLDGLAN